MPTTVKPTRAVFRHKQDTETNCGRAVVQSVISSLVQSPASGPLPPPTDPIAIDQVVLKGREIDPVDGKGDVWFTHPTELLALLKHAAELKGLPHHNPSAWRIGSHASLELLMADVVSAIGLGVPPIVNIRQVDHWVIVAGVGLDNGVLAWVQLVDPLDDPTAIAHTYRDACSALSNGHVYVPWEVPAGDLGSLSFDIGNTPPPAGMKDYSGKFVTIAHGAKASAKALRTLADSFKDSPAWRPAAILPGVDPLLGELEKRANDWGLVQLQKLLDAGPRQVVRLVSDIDGSALNHRLMSLFSDDLLFGLIAVFSATTPRLSHFRFTTDRSFEKNLASTPANEPLWWSRMRQTRYQSPYYPFRKVIADGKVAYRRLVDDAVFEPVA